MGKKRARVRGLLELESLLEGDDAVVARFRDRARDEAVTLKADGLILCTGYTWHHEHPLLASSAPFIKRANGRYQIDRNYRLVTEPAFRAGIFMQGFAEPTHGASETVLSLTSVRAGDIVKSLTSQASARDAVFG
jgi:L-ornithine N5-oxygenase